MTEGLSQFANYELGEAFFEITNSMVIKDGIPFSRIGDFELVSPSWHKLADKPDKSPQDIQKIDEDYKTEIKDLADSCIIYMAAKINSKKYSFTFDEYKLFLQATNAGKNTIPVDKAELEVYNSEIKNLFKKLANHGETAGDDLIDHKDMAAYIYALDLKAKHSENNEFQGFYLNGKITPLDYAVAYKHLREDGENMFTLKLRQAYKILFKS